MRDCPDVYRTERELHRIIHHHLRCSNAISCAVFLPHQRRWDRRFVSLQIADSAFLQSTALAATRRMPSLSANMGPTRPSGARAASALTAITHPYSIFRVGDSPRADALYH